MPREKKPTKPSEDEILNLIDAFKQFDNATAALNQAYRTLENKIDDLRAELEEKNRLLRGSVAETTRVRHFLSKILENMSSGVIVIDNNEKITLFNKMAGEITGFKPESVQGKHYLEVMGKPQNPELSLLHTLKSEKSIFKQEKSILSSRGEEKPVIFSTAVILDENEELLGAVEIFEDLTEIRELQEEVGRHQTLVELGEMAANIAHEIRNPLGGIGGFATLLERDLADDPQKQKLVRRIIEGINGLNKITSDVLLYTRKMEPDRKPVNVKNILSEAISLVSLEAEKTGVKIEYRYPKENIEASLDPDLLKRMTLNLLKNSLRAMPGGGLLAIDLSWKLLHNLLTIKIADSGVGIPPDDLNKIFNPFYTTDSKGTGLGLAIVRRIVEVHHGNIKVDSQPQKGSEFIVNLPIVSTDSAD